MTAGEDQLKPFVRQRCAWRAHRWLLQLRKLFLVPLLASQAVDALTARRGHEPGARVLGDAFARPVFEGGHECVLHALLREVEVAEALRERRGEPASLLV